jgi:hypothetical protein
MAIPDWAGEGFGSSEGVARRRPTKRQGMAGGIVIDASQAEEYRAMIAAQTALLLPEISVIVSRTGATVRKLASQRAIYTKHTTWAGMSWKSSFFTKTRRYATGVSVVIESRAQLGTILTYGVPSKRTRPHDTLGVAIEEVTPGLQAQLQALLARLI